MVAFSGNSTADLCLLVSCSWGSNLNKFDSEWNPNYSVHQTLIWFGEFGQCRALKKYYNFGIDDVLYIS